MTIYFLLVEKKTRKLNKILKTTLKYSYMLFMEQSVHL